MAKMTEQQIFARMSGHFLCQHLPDDWADWPEEKLDKFFEDNAWEPLEYWPVNDVYELIDKSEFVVTSGGTIGWEASAVDQMKGSWKDELILICLLVPAVAVFIPGWTPHIKAGFEALHSLPDYYKHLLYIACSASFGIKGAKGAMGLISKKK